MTQPRKTVFYDKHLEHGAKIVDFAGWEMPMQYAKGIIHEHLATRKAAGLFDVSHMGRFVFRGDCLPFLQHVLSNNAASLEVGQSQYTFIPNNDGGAIDDAYLYRFDKDEYLLVVNASNRKKDWAHFEAMLKDFKNVEMFDRTQEIVMLSLQGPRSKEILSELMDPALLPQPLRNNLGIAEINGKSVSIARTGYTGEPVCFEFFINAPDGPCIWDLLIEHGAQPVGLGARDTLRLEAGLPLYGHELGKDVPIFACGLARFAVSFSPSKGNFIGSEPLHKQYQALKKIENGDNTLIADLPKKVKPVVLSGKGIARAGSNIFKDGKNVGFVTSGTMVPYYKTEQSQISTGITDEHAMRSICLAMLDSAIVEGDLLQVESRGKMIDAVTVPYHLRSEAPPYAIPIIYDNIYQPKKSASGANDLPAKACSLLNKAIDNTHWRQNQCINLIPSEQTPSLMTRALSIMDPANRYAEHKPLKAFSEAEVFYYQGTDFIAEVETLLQEQMQIFLGCSQIEARLISGQMANATVFSAMVDHKNRLDRKTEPKRISRVMNHHIIRGGHLSAQPMGALRDFISHDPKTEKPGVVNFPVLAHDPYKIDIAACREMIDSCRPELIILGKSVILYKEPVAQIRSFIDEMGIDCVVMYDMAHVLGLVGPHFQEPFKEGADIVTGSTHKTFFGTQRGIVAANYQRGDLNWPLWEAIGRRAFPGSVSNHHLGTLLGLLMAAYEMNYFKDDYQKNVIANAKAFALALKDCGLDVAGDPDIDHTQTHQVIINIGYSKAMEIARRLEENNIIVNYQASPSEEGFTAAGSIRMGLSEMTRFGMEKSDFKKLAELIKEVVIEGKNIKEQVSDLRSRFTEMRYCFSSNELDVVMEKLHNLI